jgi:hypothetical protein
MRATKTMPEGYQAYTTLALAKNKRLFLFLNLVGLLASTESTKNVRNWAPS